jgi:hypothetical protein
MGTFALLVLASAAGLNPADGVLANDRVDLIEVNHFYNERGSLVFDQIIFYDWSAAEGRFHVRAWRLVKCPAQIPHRDGQRGEYVAVWSDGEVLRRVRSDSFRESWTQYDPELLEREYLPKEHRRELNRISLGQRGR